MTGGCPLIVTRPEPGNSSTVERARAMGLDARAIPLFAARPLDWTPPAAANFDALLFTSASAARLAGAGLASLSPLPAYAVGAATADAVQAAPRFVGQHAQRNDVVTCRERLELRVRDRHADRRSYQSQHE